MKETLTSICYIVAKIVYAIAIVAVLAFFIALACKNSHIHIFSLIAIACGFAGLVMAIVENVVGIFVLSKAELRAIRKRKKKALQKEKDKNIQ